MITRRPVLVAVMLYLGSASVAPAVDTPAKQDAPDLTAVRALIKAKEFATARDPLFRIMDKTQHADVYNLLGFSLRKTGDHRNALTYYQKALDFDPDHKGALEYLGELYVETKQPDKAREQRARLAKLCPTGCEELDDLDKAMRDAGMAR
jgi:tetratricopeptide (TPR) repeat protein